MKYIITTVTCVYLFTYTEYVLSILYIVCIQEILDIDACSEIKSNRQILHNLRTVPQRIHHFVYIYCINLYIYIHICT